MPKRPDAELVPNISKFRELKFHIMHGRNERVIFFEQQVDLTKIFAHLEKYNEGRELKDQLTLFQIFLCAGVRTVTLRYHLNRYIWGTLLNYLLHILKIQRDLKTHLNFLMSNWTS